MAQRTELTRGRGVVARWWSWPSSGWITSPSCSKTGRWRRYYSEIAFLENIQEAKAAVETWRDL